LKKIKQDLKRFASLRKIKFNFESDGETSHTDEDLKSLSGGLKRLNSLESMNVNFNFRCSEVTDEGLRDFSKDLKRMVNLKSIDLGFAWCE